MHKGFVAGLAIGAVFLWISVSRIDVGAVRQTLADTRPEWALLVLLCGLAFIALKTLRWAQLLRPIATARFPDLQRFVYVGTALNLIVSHTGEFLRAGLLARRAQVPVSTVMATVAIERTSDFVALLLMIALVSVLDPSLSHHFLTAGAIALAIVATALALLFVQVRAGPGLRAAGHRALGWLPGRAGAWIARQLGLAVAGFASLREPRLVLAVIALSLLQWTTIVAAIWASAQAVGVALPASAAVLVFALTVIGLTLPSSPAQLGTTQLAFVVGMEVAGAGPVPAFAASIVYTVFVVFSSMVIGAACWPGVSSARRPS